MRLYKFRGKSHDNEGKIEGEWIYGFLAAPDQIMVWDDDKATGQMFQVYPETVGQFVTLDKNGKEIYEGDNVRINMRELMGDDEWEEVEATTCGGFLVCDVGGTDFVDAENIPEIELIKD